MEQLFAEEMQQEESLQPAQTAAKQQAWIEKAKSTLASLQGEKKIHAFFNFTPAVGLTSRSNTSLILIVLVVRQAQQH